MDQRLTLGLDIAKNTFQVHGRPKPSGPRSPRTTATESRAMGEIVRVGLDIAKDVFQIHGVDVNGEVVSRRKLRRNELVAYFQKLDPCLSVSNRAQCRSGWQRWRTHDHRRRSRHNKRFLIIGEPGREPRDAVAQRNFRRKTEIARRWKCQHRVP